MRIKIDYWRLQEAESEPIVGQALTSLAARSPNDQARNYRQSSEKVIHLRHAERVANLWRGEVVSINLASTDKIAGTDGLLNPIALRPDQGLGREAAFLYSEAKRILVLQRSGSMVTPHAIAALLAQESGHVAPVTFLPVVNAEAMRRYQQMDRVTTLEVEVAGQLNPQIFSDLSTRAFVGLSGDFAAPSIALHISVGRRWRTRELQLSKVRSFVDSLLERLGHVSPGARGDGLKKLKISGSSADESQGIVDLAIERMYDILSVEPDDGRYATFGRRMQAMLEALANRETELAATYE